jgi:hypothetical protein
VFLASGQTGIGAPALRTWPQLRDAEGRSLPTNQTDEGLEHPKLLAVDYSEVTPAEVRIGTTLYQSGEEERRLETDPTAAERNSLTFFLRQPRAFLPTDSIAAVYEGFVVRERSVAFLQVGDDTAHLIDYGGVFCDRGVEDVDLARDEGRERGVEDDRLASFADWHADYVQITSELPDEDDRYWGLQTCIDDAAYFLCEDLFGTPEEPQPSRDLRIVEAYQDHLIVTPRSSDGDNAELLRKMDCCFGGEALAYVVRAGRQWVVRSAAAGFQHNVVATPTDVGLRCARDCNPRRALLVSRALEIATSQHVDAADGSGIEPCGPGECLACVMDEAGAIDSDSDCVFENITTRFAIYRGGQRTERDMAFNWEYSGGFEPLAASVAASTTSVSPQRMHWFPQSQDLVITDGASQGLVFVELDSVDVRRFVF